jgi:acetoin utilization deacetylase AcuC-like enzyme
VVPWVYAPDECILHDPGEHPESKARLQAVRTFLQLSAVGQRVRKKPSRRATPEDLALVHDPAYVERIRELCAAGGARLDPDTVVSEGSYAAACAAAGAVLEACDAVVAGATSRAACIVRPPGHHALAARAMGFCLFNNVAIGARHLQRRHGVSRVLIVDFDVHHGNGTEDTFRTDRDVFFCSLHRWPFYPGTGGPGTGGPGAQAARGTLNIPLGAGTLPAEYHAQLRRALARIEAEFQPRFVLVSAGFDAHADDPVGGLNLAVDDFRRITRAIVELAERTAGGRVVSVLEGGYSLRALPECVGAHLEGLEGLQEFRAPAAQAAPPAHAEQEAG